MPSTMVGRGQKDGYVGDETLDESVEILETPDGPG